MLAVGERVRTVKPGDRVIVPFQINCGACPDCRAGRTGSCTSVPPASMYGMSLVGGLWGGAFADELPVPFADAMLVALPEGIDPVAAASVADNVCDAYRHIAPHLPALLEEDPDAEVLIVAALHRRTPFGSSTPLYTGLIARAFGARNVSLVDARPAVRAHAERLGLNALSRASCAAARRRRWSSTRPSKTSASRSRTPPPTASARASAASTAAPRSRSCGCTCATRRSTSAAPTPGT